MIFNKEKTLKLSDYIQIRKPQYIYISIVPHKSTRNYNSNSIAKAIVGTYKAINKRIYKEQGKLIIESSFKISYIIDIQDNNAKFYFLVPSLFLNTILEKIKEVWSKATIEVLEDGIEGFGSNAVAYSLSYKKEDALSLDVDRKSNEPLNSILSVMEVMQEGDRVTIIYNFMPNTQASWKEQYRTTMDNITAKKSIDKKVMSFDYIFRNGVVALLGVLEGLLNVIGDFVGADSSATQESLYTSIMGVLERQDELSVATKKKKEATVLETQILIIGEGTGAEANIINTCQAYSSIDGDNELTYKKVKLNKKKPLSTIYYDYEVDKCIFSADEVGNFLQIPGRVLLNQFGIKHIKTEESKVPEQLKSGYIELGSNKYKGEKIETYLEDDKEIGSLPLFLLGRQGGGKTTFLKNYVRNCRTRKESVIHIDFIRNNESSEAIEKVSDNPIILDFSTEEGLQSFCFNESKFTDNMSWFEKQAIANKKTGLTIELIDSINDTGDPLSPKMGKYLAAATDIVYLNDNATLKDVVKCLQDYQKRKEYIENVPLELLEELEEEIRTLKELDETNKAGEVVGTRDSKIEGIIDRITLLKRDFYLKKMFNKNPANNIDFIKAMEEGRNILIRMPQSKFKRYVKNVITTFLVTKCWISCEERGDLNENSKRTHILIDEISQTKTAERYMLTTLTQTRKYGMKFVLTGQYLDQLDKDTIYSLKGAGASFMLLKGAIIEDYNYLKSEIDEQYEYEDLKNMEEWSSFNLINYSKGYASFITKLPYRLA